MNIPTTRTMLIYFIPVLIADTLKTAQADYWWIPLMLIFLLLMEDLTKAEVSK